MTYVDDEDIAYLMRGLAAVLMILAAKENAPTANRIAAGLNQRARVLEGKEAVPSE